MMWRCWASPRYLCFRCASADIICALFSYEGGSPRAFDTHLTPSCAPEARARRSSPAHTTQRLDLRFSIPCPAGGDPGLDCWVSPTTSGTGSGEGQYGVQGQQLISAEGCRCMAYPRRAPGRLFLTPSARRCPSATAGAAGGSRPVQPGGDWRANWLRLQLPPEG